ERRARHGHARAGRHRAGRQGHRRLPLHPSLMHTRRDFLKGLLGAAAVAVAPPRPDLRVLQIGIRLPEGSSLQKGASLAMSEAKRTADLLRVVLRWGVTSGEVRIAHAAPAQEPPVPFLVAGVPEVILKPPRPRIF